MERAQDKEAVRESPYPTIAMLGSLATFVWGLCRQSLQIIDYLQKGIWTPDTCFDVMKHETTWLENPGSWVGLNNILRKIMMNLGVSVFLVLSSIVLLFFALVWSESEAERLRRARAGAPKTSSAPRGLKVNGRG